MTLINLTAFKCHGHLGAMAEKKSTHLLIDCYGEEARQIYVSVLIIICKDSAFLSLEMEPALAIE